MRSKQFDRNQNQPGDTLKLSAIQCCHGMTARFSRGHNLQITFTDHPALGFQLRPDSCMFTRLSQSKWQHRVILQQSFDKLNPPLTDMGIGGAGATVQKLRRRDRRNKKRLSGMRGQKIRKTETPSLGGNEQRAIENYSHAGAWGVLWREVSKSRAISSASSTER